MDKTNNEKKQQIHFGQCIAKMRERRRLTQADAGVGANMALSTISKQERTKNCHLRTSKLQALANYYHSVDPLTEDEIEVLTHDGSLSPGFTPKAMPRPSSGASASTLKQLEQTYGGQLRNACQSVHEQILAESSAADYLALLCQCADKLNVSIVVDPK